MPYKVVLLALAGQSLAAVRSEAQVGTQFGVMVLRWARRPIETATIPPSGPVQPAEEA